MVFTPALVSIERVDADCVGGTAIADAVIDVDLTVTTFETGVTMARVLLDVARANAVVEARMRSAQAADLVEKGRGGGSDEGRGTKGRRMEGTKCKERKKKRENLGMKITGGKRW